MSKNIKFFFIIFIILAIILIIIINIIISRLQTGLIGSPSEIMIMPSTVVREGQPVKQLPEETGLSSEEQPDIEEGSVSGPLLY